MQLCIQVPLLVLCFTQDDASGDKETKESSSGTKDEMMTIDAPSGVEETLGSIEEAPSFEEDAESPSSMKKVSTTSFERDTLMIDNRAKRRHLERDLGQSIEWQSPVRVPSSPGGFDTDLTPKVTPRMTPELDTVMSDSPCAQILPMPQISQPGGWINI